MFENYAIGELTDDELVDTMEIIAEAKKFSTEEKRIVDKGLSRKERKLLKEENCTIERAAIIMQDLVKFTTPAGEKRLQQAHQMSCQCRDGLIRAKVRFGGQSCD